MSETFTQPERSTQSSVFEARDVCVELGGHEILHNISFWIPKGEFLCLCGPNGAGKSTFLKTTLGLVSPTGGSIEVMGRPLTENLRLVGYVPQRKGFDRRFPARAIDLIVAAMRGTWPVRIRSSERDRAHAVLKRVGGEELIDKHLSGLSGGETQRVFLARALINDPVLLILDEPTAGVDALGCEEFMDILAEISASDELAAILVTHNLAAVARTAERVLYLQDGRVAAWGLFDELMSAQRLQSLRPSRKAPGEDR